MGDMDNPDIINVFSFFVAVASIIATLVYGMLGDTAKELSVTSGKILKSMQREYAFIAVFSLFMAMSLALAYAHSDRSNKLDLIAGEVLDAFLVLSLSLALSMYLFRDLTYEKVTMTTLMIDLMFFVLICSLYYSEGKHIRFKVRFKTAHKGFLWVMSKIPIPKVPKEMVASLGDYAAIIVLLLFLFGNKFLVGWFSWARFSWTLSILFLVIFLTKWIVDNVIFDLSKSTKSKSSPFNNHTLKYASREENAKNNVTGDQDGGDF